MEAPQKPAEMIGRDVPDVALTDTDGRRVALRDIRGRASLALFFYLRNGTPG